MHSYLIAYILSGFGEQLNYVPMKSSLNRGQWKSMEAEWETILEGRPNANPPIPSQAVDINIHIEYDANGSRRPEEFIVTETIGTNIPVTRPPIQNP